MLISSFFIYNSNHTIDANALDTLAAVMLLAGQIKVEGDHASIFPDFLWIVRNMHLTLKDANGSTITPHDYLEEKLQPSKTSDSKSQESLQTIKKCFPVRNCCSSWHNRRMLVDWTPLILSPRASEFDPMFLATFSLYDYTISINTPLSPSCERSKHTSRKRSLRKSLECFSTGFRV
jgi:hypothetical protein